MVVNVTRILSALCLGLAIVLVGINSCQCQERDVEPTAAVEQAEATQLVQRVLVYDGVELSSESEEESATPIVVVRTDAPTPLVRGYLSTNPFPPTRLMDIGEGRFVLLGAPGSRWTIEILSVVDGAIWSEFLEAQIGGEPIEPEPPADEPDEPPESDWSHLTELVVRSSQVAEDPLTASRLAKAYRNVLESTAGEPLETVHAAISEARAEVFEAGRLTTNWNALLITASEMVDDNPPTTADEYRAIIHAFIRGLEADQ